MKKRQKKGMSLEECVEKARKYIGQQGFCILCYDVIGSGEISDFEKVFSRMNLDISKRFKGYLCNHPEISCSELGSIGLRDRFETYRGDMASACVNSPEGVKEIIQYHQRKYQESVPLRFVVGRDYRDPVLREI